MIHSLPIIELKNVSLKIPILSPESRNLKRRILRSTTGGLFLKSRQKLEVVALKCLNLSFTRGEKVALIGHNGSGKTSFLRLISGIYKPSEGDLDLRVNVYPMLQKSFLTSSELSGLEAVKAHYLFLNRKLKGFEDYLEEIIDFSGLGAYIAMPLKSYSDGMSARLMFSILTSSEHDCLALDEGLGTGDASFFNKAQKRMESFVHSAGSLFLASHSEELLMKFCTRGLVFNHGEVVYDGILKDALNYYGEGCDK